VLAHGTQLPVCNEVQEESAAVAAAAAAAPAATAASNDVSMSVSSSMADGTKGCGSSRHEVADESGTSSRQKPTAVAAAQQQQQQLLQQQQQEQQQDQASVMLQLSCGCITAGWCISEPTAMMTSTAPGNHNITISNSSMMSMQHQIGYRKHTGHTAPT
jgi:hypothetical protein